jgi:curved DNA-binding protein CbpA
LKNYYAILELSVNAEPKEIRAAFRRLVKIHHPDVSDAPDAQSRFMEIQEAYEFLTDDAQRLNYNRLWNQSYVNQQEQFRREQIYKLWVEHNRKKHAQEASQPSRKSRFSAQKVSGIYKRVDNTFNVIFLILFALIIVLPLWRYTHQDHLPLELRRPFYRFIWPIVLGSIFLVSGYYFWFKDPDDEE